MRLAIPALALLVTSGCFEPLQLVAEAPNACLITSGVPLVGADAFEEPVLLQAMPNYSTTVSRRLEYPVDSALLFGDPGSTRLFLTSMTLLAEAGGFDFVEEAVVSVARSPEADAELVPVLRYVRTGDPGATLEIVAEEPVDLAEYVQEGRVAFELALTSAVPPTSTSIEVKVCFAAEKTIAYAR